MGGILGNILGIFSSGRQAADISNANIAAEHGVLGATGNAQSDIQSILYGPGGGMDLFNQARGSVAPYLASGYQGNTALQNYAASNPQFSFNPSQYFNSPGYNFQLQQGTNAITNAASVSGFGGNTLRDLTTFGQGLAANYYNQAFNQAQNTFETNQQATLQNLNALLNQGQFGTAEQGRLVNAQAGLALGGTEAAGQLGVGGATTAGNFAVNAGLANAAGTAGQYNNISGIATGISGLLSGLGFI